MCVLTSTVRKQAPSYCLVFQSGTLPCPFILHSMWMDALLFDLIFLRSQCLFCGLTCLCPPHCPVDARFPQFGLWFYYAGQASTDPTWSPCLPLPELPHPTLGCLYTWTRSLPSWTVIFMSLHGHSSHSTCVSTSQVWLPCVWMSLPCSSSGSLCQMASPGWMSFAFTWIWHWISRPSLSQIYSTLLVFWHPLSDHSFVGTFPHPAQALHSTLAIANMDIYLALPNLELHFQ